MFLLLCGCECESCYEDIKIVRVCAIGDKTGESCVEHSAYRYDVGTKFFHIRTRDGERLAYNLDGWSIVLIKYRKRRD